MASDSVITDVDREQIREYLGEIVRAGDDFSRFVEEQFDTLEALAMKLQDRERDLEAQRTAVSGQLAGLTQSRERLEAASVAAERWAAQAQTHQSATTIEGSPDHSVQIASALAELQSNHVRLNEELTAAQAQLNEELASAQAQAKSHFTSLAQSVTAELAEARSQLSAASEELALERQKIVEAAEPLLSAAAAAIAAPRVVEAAPTASMPPASAPIETPTPPTAEVLAEPRRTAETTPPPSATGSTNTAASPAAPSPAATAEDETAGWWGELQQLRRGLSKAVQSPSESPPRRSKTPAAS